MTAAPNFNDLDLPDVVGLFSLEPSGLIVLAGDSERCRETAQALAEYIGAATGRQVIAITSGPVLPAQPGAGEPPVILIDAVLSPDKLSELVEAVSRGALIIATLGSERPYPYTHLIDLAQAAEDWSGEFRRDFEAALYAVVTLPEAGPGAPETAVHPGSRLQR